MKHIDLDGQELDAGVVQIMVAGQSSYQKFICMTNAEYLKEDFSSYKIDNLK